MAVDIKLSKCNCNLPWGFRLSGGVDFSYPLTVVRVAIGSLADKAGLKAGDVVIKMNGEPIQQLTHSQVHDKIVKAGRSFVLSVVRDLPLRRVQRDADDHSD